MPSTRLPVRLRPGALRSGVARAYRQHAEETRVRREHDQAIAADPRFAQEHRLQVTRSIDGGRGGCPYCAD
jgi:hypothetical protein